MHAKGKASDRASKVIVDQQGNIIVAGYAGREFARPDAFIIKYSPVGDTLWNYYYDGPDSDPDQVLDLKQDNNGNIYFCGTSETVNGNPECITGKLDAAGNELWVNRWPGVQYSQSSGNSLAIDDSGNVYTAGWYRASSYRHWLVIKYNAAGATQWSEVLNTPNSLTDEAASVVITPNQNATVCGFIYNASNNRDAYIKQYTPSGSTAWDDVWDNPSANDQDWAYSIRNTSNNELRIGGETETGSVDNRNVFVLSYTQTGTQLWTTVYSDSTTTDDEYFVAMNIDASGNTVIAASNFEKHNIYKVNANGSQAWKSGWDGPIPGSQYDSPFDIITDANGNVYTTGTGIFPGPPLFVVAGLTKFVVTKFSSAGDSLWTFVNSSNVSVSLGAAAVYSSGKVYAVGFLADTAYVDENFYTIALDTAGTLLSEWNYNGEGDAITKGQFVLTDAQDNIYSAATSDRLYNYGWDVVLVKYDAAGTLLWQQDYSSFGWRNDTLTAMMFDNAGNIIMSISSDTSGDHTGYQPSLVKVSPAGIMLDTGWFNTGSSGIHFANSMVQCTDGSIVLGVNSATAGGSLLCFDAALDFQWQAEIDSSHLNHPELTAIAKFSNDDIAVTGNIPLAGKLFVQRINAAGTRAWGIEIDSASVQDEGNDITISALGDIAITGAAGFTTQTCKISGINGNVIWRSVYNPTTTSSEYGMKVKFTPAGSVAIISRGYTGFVSRWYTVQYNGTTGAEQWASTYSGVTSTREPLKLLVEPSGRVITAGYQVSGNTIPNYDYVIAGYNSTGTQQFTGLFSTPGFYPDILADFTRDQQGNYIATGKSAQSFLNDYWYHMATVKFGSTPVGVNEVQTYTSLSVYPNPSAEGLFILDDYSGSSHVSSAEVFDITGRRVLSLINIEPFQQIDLSNSPAGLYLMHFTRDDHQQGTVRLIRK